MASKLLSRLKPRRLSKPHCPYPSQSSSSSPLLHRSRLPLLEALLPLRHYSRTRAPSPSFTSSRSFSSEDSHGPAAIDYRSLLQEDEFHKVADFTIHDLQEKLEEYGDSVQVDGFDIDYGNEVLTIKLGDLGTYVLNKQTPNRQLWLSSPLSGPSRFDWDQNAQAWTYRRTKANLLRVLESELQQLCGEPINLT